MFHDERVVEAGGNRIRLAIDFLALDAIEGATGLKMPDIVRAIAMGTCQLTVSATTLWGLLLRHHPEITVDEAASLIFGDHRPAFGDAISALFDAAFNLGPIEEGDDRPKSKWNIRDFLVEWVALGGSPAEFWRQTPKSFVAVMEGMARVATRQHDISIVTAWHTAVFALSGYAGKLKPLADFLSTAAKVNSEDDQRLGNAKIIHFFNSLKERGVPIDIRRVN